MVVTMPKRWKPKPWEEAYRVQGRLWRGGRLDAATILLLTEAGPVDGLWFDAGCGDGSNLVKLTERLAEHQDPAPIVGADLAVWGLRRAREAFQERDTPLVPLVQADMLHWPFADRAFTAIRAVHLVGHVRADDRPRAVAELVRVLRPGGRIVFAEFGTNDFRAGQGVEVEPHTWRRGHGVETHYFTEPELVALATDAGLVVDRVQVERFDVRYGDADRVRERWLVMASRPLEMPT